MRLITYDFGLSMVEHFLSRPISPTLKKASIAPKQVSPKASLRKGSALEQQGLILTDHQMSLLALGILRGFQPRILLSQPCSGWSHLIPVQVRDCSKVIYRSC